MLSLDAPLVAVAWLYIFAKTWRADYLPWISYIALALVVWVIYVTDRLLDSSIQDGTGGRFESRHVFHRKHAKLFRIAAIFAGILAMILVIGSMPMRIFENAGLGIILVIGFFALSVNSSTGPNDIPYAKNVMAGLAFGFGTSVIAFVYTAFDWWEFVMSPQLVCFAVLCVLNISAIDLWEHAGRSSDPEVKASDELALTLPLTLLGGSSIYFAARDHELATRPFFYAILTGAALLHIINRTRSRFSMDALRVLADVALLIPFVVFLAASKS
ncbi:hypothetical protein JIN84_18630 [Luteolibacter yonseiensis]|uniref:Uncharacterized protein n=1 Tax=Luteolibacter yonseiensis TaxID=1144680 RepID=A0A934V8V0_9BACT|nr:hypothetical protein [Luteolibacter yonseiensis]MBK1817642.1 hypothetical protein [Luteolibacter yonseiensis]